MKQYREHANGLQRRSHLSGWGRRLVFACALSLLAPELSWTPGRVSGFIPQSDLLSDVSNFPNPFSSSFQNTTITYRLREDARVVVSIFDLLGSPVQELAFEAGQENARAGLPARIIWDGTNEAGEKVSRGGYLCRIRVESPSGVAESVRKIAVIH